MDCKIRNIIFDFGGVLINLDKPRCVEALGKLGFKQAGELINSYYQQGIFEKMELGLITPEEFCSGIRKISGSKASDKEIFDAWNLLLADIPTYRLQALLELRKHYMVYLLSNTNKVHWDYSCENQFHYRGFDVNDYFEDMFLSFQLHETKPSPKIFEEVLAQTGILPNETLFIDDAAPNCETARKLGFKTYCTKEGEDWRHLFDKELLNKVLY